MYNKDALIYVSRECNMSCAYCYNEINPDKKNIKDINAYEKKANFLEHLVNNGTITRIMITGGEPLMSQQTFNLIERFRNKVQISIYTNGILLKEISLEDLRGVDVKISLHGILTEKGGIDKYKEMVSLLENAKIRYGFIYMVTKENFGKIHDIYHELLSNGNIKNFSMKYQPLFIPKDSDRNLRLRNRFSLANLSIEEWNEFEKQVLRIINFERNIRKDSDIAIYPFYENNHEYLLKLRDFYINGTIFTRCDTAPIIVIGPDGVVHPCMFLFKERIGNIITSNTASEILQNPSEEDIKSMKCAKCFSEECLGALRPYHK